MSPSASEITATVIASPGQTAARFDAFISYAQRGDRRIAGALRDGLHRFARRPFEVRAMRVFLDQATLEPSGGLPSKLRQNLEASRWLILLASPEAAASAYVQLAIERWLSLGRIERLLLVLTAGGIAWNADANDVDRAATDALPPALHGAFAEEPLWEDLRWARAASDLSLGNADFGRVVARLAARIRDVPVDTLWART